MTQAEKDHRALVRLLTRAKTKSRGAAALDSAIRSGISLTATEQQNLKYQQALKYEKRTVAMDSGPSKGARFVTQRHDKRLTVGPVSGFYKHPGQRALDSVDNHELENRDLFGVEPNDDDTYAAEDAVLTEEEEQQLAESLRADFSTVRDSTGKRLVGLEAANQAYAQRHGQKIARVS